jgi:hypothetical protein
MLKAILKAVSLIKKYMLDSRRLKLLHRLLKA